MLEQMSQVGHMEGCLAVLLERVLILRTWWNQSRCLVLLSFVLCRNI